MLRDDEWNSPDEPQGTALELKVALVLILVAALVPIWLVLRVMWSFRGVD